MNRNPDSRLTVGNGLLPPAASTFSPEDWRILSQHWYPLAWAADVDVQPVQITLLDVKLVLYRTTLGVMVALDRCPHRGVPLSKGAVVDDQLVCAYHGLRFGADGYCKAIPAHPELQPSNRIRMFVLPSIERYGLIWTSLAAQGEPVVPALPVWDDPDYERIAPPSIDIGGSAGRQVEGFIDVAHFPYVHNTAFADPDNVVVPPYVTETTEFGLRSHYYSYISNYPKALQHLAPANFHWLRVYEVFPPFAAKLIIHFPAGQQYHILNLASPVSARLTRLFVPIARNFDSLGTVAEILAFNAQIFGEDKLIVETQDAITLDPVASVEESFAADRTSVGYRRLLKAMGLKFA